MRDDEIGEGEGQEVPAGRPRTLYLLILGIILLLAVGVSVYLILGMQEVLIPEKEPFPPLTEEAPIRLEYPATEEGKWEYPAAREGKEEIASEVEGKPEVIPETLPASPPEAPEEPLGGGDHFEIQVGAYLFPDNLSKYKEKLISLGYTPLVHPALRRVLIKRILIGPYRSIEQARKIEQQIASLGVETFILPLNYQMFAVHAGAYYYRKIALGQKKRFLEQGYPTSFQETYLPLELYELRIGGIDTQVEVQKTLDSLSEEGFSQCQTIKFPNQ